MSADRGQDRWVVGLVATVSFMVSLDVLVITTSLGEIRTDLNATIGSLEGTLTSYDVCLAALLLLGAALGDRFGRRRMLLIGIATFTAGSITCAAAPVIGVLIAGRTVQGIGAALMAPLGLPLIAAAVERGRRGRALGLVVGISGLATFAGPLLGGGVAAVFGWQWIFWINVPVGLALLALIRVHITESRGRVQTFDLLGVTLVTGATASVAWGLARAADTRIADPHVLAALLLGVVLTLCFVLRERSARYPMLDMSLLRSRRFVAINIATACHSVLVLGAVFVMAQFLQAALGVDTFGAGVRLLPWTGTMMLVGPLAGRLADRIGPSVVSAVGLGIAGVGYAWLAVASVGGVTYSALVVPLLVVGIGNSAVFPAISAAVAHSVAEDQVGVASGLNAAVRQVGGVFGIALAGLAFSKSGGFDDPAAAAAGFRAAAWLFVVLGALGAAASISARGARRGRPHPSLELPAAVEHTTRWDRRAVRSPAVAPPSSARDLPGRSHVV